MKERKKQVETAESATYSIPQAGSMAGLSRNGSYDAARRGEIPVIKFGRVYRVPKAIWDRKLGLVGNKNVHSRRDAEIDQHGNFGSVVCEHSQTR
jgi:hypothetical protein